MYLDWNHVNSHTDVRDYDQKGNRQVALMAQTRLKVAKLSLIFPPGWKGEDAFTEVPPDDAHRVVTEVHEGLGHVGHEKILKVLKRDLHPCSEHTHNTGQITMSAMCHGRWV